MATGEVLYDCKKGHSATEVLRPLAPALHAHQLVLAEPGRTLVPTNLTHRRPRRGVFNSVAALTEAIETWAEHWNDDPRPFLWHTPAKDIIAKVRRGRAALTRTKSATRH